MSKVRYTKTALTYTQQLQQLKDRGLSSVCAHHSRLWNRAMSIQPIIPRTTDGRWISNKSIPNSNTYFILSMLVFFMDRIKYENDVVSRFKELLSKYRNIDPEAMGFPINWQDEPLWK